MTNSSAPLPVYQTLALSRLVGWGRGSWKRVFPFSATHGMWTFNGRTALHVGLRALNLPKGSVVLFPNYYQGVEIDTILHNGLSLRYYRIDSQLRPDLDQIKSLLDAEVSALYVIHYFGFAQDMPAMRKITDRYGIKLIEDCALALLSCDSQGWLGTYGDISIFSVYKSLALPHGGYLVSRTPLPAHTLRPPPWLSTVRQTTDRIQEHWQARGWTGLERTMRALLGGIRRAVVGAREPFVHSGGVSWDPQVLKYSASAWTRYLMRHNELERVRGQRRLNYQHLAERLSDHSRCLFPDLPAHTCPLFFPVLVHDKHNAMNRLWDRGIGSVNLWWDNHPLCPESEAREVRYLREHVLELPIHQDLMDHDIERLADAYLAAHIEPLER